MDVATFAAAIGELASEIATTNHADLSALRNRVPATWTVQAGGERVVVSARWIVAAMDGAASDPAKWISTRATLSATLTAIKAEAEMPAASSQRAIAGAAQARGVLNDVLSRREFENSRGRTWMKTVREWVAERLVKLWQRLGGERLGRRGTAVALAWISALAALAVLAGWLVKGLVRASRDPGFHLGAAPSRRKSARAWALQARASTDARETARCAYRATVRRLEEEGAWRIDDARTPREYLRLLPPAHSRRAIVAGITGRFEQIWYGAREATPDDSRKFLSELKDLGCLPAD